MWVGQTQKSLMRFPSSETTGSREGRDINFTYLLEAEPHYSSSTLPVKRLDIKVAGKNSLPGYLQVGNWKTGRNFQT